MNFWHKLCLFQAPQFLVKGGGKKAQVLELVNFQDTDSTHTAS